MLQVDYIGADGDERILVNFSSFPRVALIVIHKFVKARHSGMDPLRAFLPGALRVNANPFQTDLCRNPDSMGEFELTIHGTGYPLPAGYNEPSQ
jgi:hypothetical protein